MKRYAARAIGSAVIVLVISSVVIFLLIRLAPGDPASILAGTNASPHTIALIRDELGLTESLPAQYASWVGSLVTLDLGRSYVVGGEITTLITNGLTNTLVLAAGALVVALILTAVMALGVTLLNRGWAVSALTLATSLFLAIPTFVTGPLLVVLFAVTFGLLPAGGVPPLGLFVEPVETLEFLIMPAVCLGIPVGAALTRFLFEALQTELQQPYVLTARAAGIRRLGIVTRHAVPNALPPTITVLGIQIGYLLGGTVLVEAIFAWPGLGELAQRAITGRDYPLVQVLLMLFVFFYILIQIVTDLIHAHLDPRVRVEGGDGS